MKKGRKNHEGITLIALVVTIVVLLILAGVTINAILGDNGIIAQAKKADEAAKQGAINDEESLNNLSDQINSMLEGESVLPSGTGEKTLVQMFKDGELKVGDYVNYQNPTSGTYTVTAAKSGMDRAGVEIENQTFDVANNQLHWRVLGLSEDKQHLLLISGRPIKSEGVNTEAKAPHFYMYGANAYEYGVEELNNICNIYKNDLAEKVRSITMSDINRILGIQETAEEINKVAIYYSDGKKYGESYEFESYRLVAQYTPKSYLEEQEAIKSSTGEKGSMAGHIEGNIDGYYYTINGTDLEEPTVKVTDEKIKELLFTNVEYNENGVYGANYWLASRGVSADSGGAQFGLGSVCTDVGISRAGTYVMFGSSGGEIFAGFAVRPVVSLKSNLTGKDLQKTDQSETEENWNYGKVEKLEK